MFKPLRNIVIAVLIATVGLILIVRQQQINEANAPTAEDQIIDETTVEVGDLTVNVSATGTISPLRQVPLVFEVSAPVVDVLARPGDFVAAGDVIARLDPLDYELAVDDARIGLDFQRTNFDALTTPPRQVDIAVAEANLTAAQASYNAAFATGPTVNQVEISRLQVQQAGNGLWQAQLSGDPIINQSDIEFPEDFPEDLEDGIREGIDNINRQRRNATEGAVISGEYGVDIAENNYQGIQNRGPDLGSLNSANSRRIQAQISLDQLRNGPGDDQLQVAQIDLNQAELTVQQAETALDSTELTAPFDGVIAQSDLTVGELPPNGPAVVLMDTSTFVIDLPIDETEIVNVVEGQRVTLIFDALPDADILGTVTRVAVTPNEIGGLVTYLVRVELDATDAPVRIGMSATARIATESLNDVLLVRNRFIRIDRVSQQAFVTILTDEGEFMEIPVELGIRNEFVTQITSGLTAGQRVVLVPSDG